MPPKVSVVIPTWNRAKYLRLAIHSVLRQTFEDFEIIVVDDASKDKTRQVVYEFGDDRIRYISHDENRGSCASRNTGINNAKGEFIAFLDDDDLWLPTKLEKQLVLFDKNPDIGVVYTGAWSINEEGELRKSLRKPSLRGNIYPTILEKNYVGGCSVALVRKECFEVTGLFDEELPINPNDDWDLWIRMAKNFKFDYINEPLVLYRIHKNRISSDPKSKILAIRLMFRKFARDLHAHNNRKILAFWHYKFAIHNCELGDMKEARKEFLMAIAVHPLSITCYIRLSISFLGKRVYDAAAEFLDSVLPGSFKYKNVY